MAEQLECNLGHRPHLLAACAADHLPIILPSHVCCSGIATGVDMGRLLDASDFICKALGKRNNSRAAEALLAKRNAAETAATAA